MLQPGQKVLVAVSGGPDSVVLLDILHKLARRLDFKLGVAHLNHCLRGSRSDDDEKFVCRLAARAGLKFYCRQADVAALQAKSGLSLEEAGRRARYAFLEKIAASDGFDKIALGHQADDNAEQLLLHLLRGSGPDGLAGIPPVRGRLIRPLMDITRGQILAWAEFYGLEFRIDASNADPRFTRNRIRRRLLPILEKEFNPNIRSVLHRTACLLRQEQQWLRELAAGWAKQVVIARRRGEIDLEAETLASMPKAQGRRVLRYLIGDLLGYLRGFTAVHLDALLELSLPGKDGRELHLPLGTKARRTGPVLQISLRGWSHPDRDEKTWSLEVDPQADSYKKIELPGGGRIELEVLKSGPGNFRPAVGREEAYFDMDKLDMPLTIRNFRKGDRIMPFGLNGSQKLKKLFIDRKIPRRMRSELPLVISGGQIAWVAGIRRANLAPVTRNTSRILHLRYRGPAACK